jgi:hypothetical protein
MLEQRDVLSVYEEEFKAYLLEEFEKSVEKMLPEIFLIKRNDARILS